MLTNKSKKTTIIWNKVLNGGVGMIFEKVRAIICDQLELDEDVVTLDAVLLEDLGADSIDLADLVMTLEDEFDMEISDEELENIRTVADIVKFIEEN